MATTGTKTDIGTPPKRALKDKPSLSINRFCTAAGLIFSTIWPSFTNSCGTCTPCRPASTSGKAYTGYPESTRAVPAPDTDDWGSYHGSSVAHFPFTIRQAGLEG